MSKTYWLVSSNGIPKPTKKDNQLLLGDVNAGSVRELKRSEKYDYIYYLKDTDESILDKNITSKLSFKTKLEAIKMIPHGLKDALLYLFAYFIFYAIFTIRQNENAPIYLAFAAAISAILISFVKIFKLDPTYGPIVTMLIGAGVSCIITGWYLKIDSIIILPSFLEKNNIGNILTVFCSVITFLGYSNDSISFYRRDMHISKVEQN